MSKKQESTEVVDKSANKRQNAISYAQYQEILKGGHNYPPYSQPQIKYIDKDGNVHTKRHTVKEDGTLVIPPHLSNSQAKAEVLVEETTSDKASWQLTKVPKINDRPKHLSIRRTVKAKDGKDVSRSLGLPTNKKDLEVVAKLVSGSVAQLDEL
jgi:hypothetical protein